MIYIYWAILLYYSFSASAQQSTLHRCALTYDSVGHCKVEITATGYICKEGSHFSGSAAAVNNCQSKSALHQDKKYLPFNKQQVGRLTNFSPSFFLLPRFKKL